MIQSATNQETVKSIKIDIIFSQNALEFIINSQKLHTYNRDIILSSLRILKLFLTHKRFKQILIENIGMQHLIPIASFYSDQDIQKLLLNIIKEVLGLALTCELSKEIYSIVLEVIRNSSDNISIAETAIGIWKLIASDILSQLVSEESIETYCVLFICMRGEVDFEMQLLGLFKIIRDCSQGYIEVLRNSKKIESCVLKLMESYSIESTGSLSSNASIYLKLRMVAEEVLG